VDPDPVEAGPDSAEAGLCQVRTGEGSSRPGARAGQEEGGQRQPHGSEGRQEVWICQQAGVKLPVEAVGGCPRAEGGHDGQSSSL